MGEPHRSPNPPRGANASAVPYDARVQWDRVRKHLGGRGEWWWAPILYTLAVAWIYRGLWHQHGLPTGLGWDTQDSYGPDLQFLARDYHDGRFSLWNPYDHGGYSLVADIGFPRWYPVHWLFAGWGALFGAGWWLIQIEVLAHHVIAGCTMHAYLRSRGCGRGAAFVGGLTMVASAAFLLHKASILLWPIAWAPIVLIAIDRVHDRPGWRSGAWLGGAIALVGLAGSPPSFFYVLMFVAPYGLVAVVASWLGAASRRQQAMRLASAIAIGASIAIGALAVAILPTRELVPLAQRADMKGEEFALNAPLGREDTFAAMVAPTSGNLSASVGVIAVALALCALVIEPRRHRGAPIVFVSVGLFALVLTFGTKGHLLPWLIRHGPLFDLFRAPARYRLITTLGLAASAGMGANLLARTPRAWTWPRWAAIATAALVLALAAWAVLAVPAQVPPVPPFPRAAHWSSLFALAAAAIVVALVLVPPRFVAAPLVVAAALIANEVPFFLHTPDSPPANEPRRTHAHDDEILARLGDVSVAYRIYDEFILGERVGPRRRVRDFRGYPAIDPLSQKRYLDVILRARKSPEILEAFNVRWILHAGHFRDGLFACFVAGPPPPPHFVDRGGGRFEALHPAPLAAWYGAVRIADTPAAALDLVQNAEVLGVRTYATVERDELRGVPVDDLAVALRAGAATTTARVTSYDPNAIDLELDAPAAGVVVLNEVWYPGWHVTVDGDDATPMRVDYLLRGVAVSAGHHAIAWRFHPTHFRPLFAMYALALLGVLAAFVWPRRREHATLGA